ncbi:MAG: hypothetical protein LH606_03530 [Cytophagaceae bacterium]|nr:hypothetical protein [Cytophagaceae bacterium]
MFRNLFLLLLGVFFLNLSGCRREGIAVFENKKETLQREWRQSTEEEPLADRKIFRNDNYAFPETQSGFTGKAPYRQTYSFAKDGKVLVSKLLKNNTITQYTGTWDYSETTEMLNVNYFDGEAKKVTTLTYEIITLVQDKLVVKTR